MFETIVFWALVALFFFIILHWLVAYFSHNRINKRLSNLEAFNHKTLSNQSEIKTLLKTVSNDTHMMKMKMMNAKDDTR